jgi:hypothetical protein
MQPRLLEPSMRTSRISGLLVVVCLVATGAAAQDSRAFVQGVGGIRLTSAPGLASSFGAMVGGSLTPNIDAVGEFGRMSDVMPPLIDTALAFTYPDFQMSAFYGAGGVRLLTPSTGHVRAYGETIGGFARLSNSLRGIDSPTDAIVNTALTFVNTTEPLAAAGAGVIFQGGSFVATAGYRFTRIFARDTLAGLLTGGNLDISEVRVGIGVRF